MRSTATGMMVRTSCQIYFFPRKSHNPYYIWYPCPTSKRWRCLDRGNIWINSTWTSIDADRKSRESCVHEWECADVASVQNNVHMSLALRMLGASEVYITRIELHRYREVLRNVQFSVPPLKKLQELVLDLPYRIDYSEIFN